VRKFWGSINQTLLPGDTVTLRVANRYNTYRAGNAKWVVLTTHGAMGGRNHTFGIVWLIMGIACMVAVAAYVYCGRTRLALPTQPDARVKWLSAHLSWQRHKRR